MLTQRNRNILGKFLSLYQRSDQISIANLSEIVLFTCGINRVLRLVVKPTFASEIQKTFINDNLYFLSGKSYLSVKDNGWVSISNIPIDSEIRTQTLLVLGNKKSDVRDCFENELNGEFRISGKYFNYPDCCIESYPLLSSSENKWAYTLLENSGPGPYPCWANRIATGWGGACFSGELFPCSLHCKNANSIGKKTYDCLLNIGFKKLAKELLQQSLTSLIVFEDGRVERVLNNQKNNLNIINFFK